MEKCGGFVCVGVQGFIQEFVIGGKLGLHGDVPSFIVMH